MTLCLTVPTIFCTSSKNFTNILWRSITLTLQKSQATSFLISYKGSQSFPIIYSPHNRHWDLFYSINQITSLPFLNGFLWKLTSYPWAVRSYKTDLRFFSELIFHHLFLLLLTVLQTNHSSLRYLNIQVHSYLEAFAVAGPSIPNNPMKFSGLHGSVSLFQRGSCWPTLWRCPAFPHSWLSVPLTFLVSFTASVTLLLSLAPKSWDLPPHSLL